MSEAPDEERDGMMLTHLDQPLFDGAEADTARRRISEPEDDLTGERESLRRMIRAENRGR